MRRFLVGTESSGIRFPYAFPGDFVFGVILPHRMGGMVFNQIVMIMTMPGR